VEVFVGDKYGLFIGTKIILAASMSKHEFNDMQGKPHDGSDEPGFNVIYPDGYSSWSPVKSFNGAYRLVSSEELTLLTGKPIGA
jgi:hypothetical protein